MIIYQTQTALIESRDTARFLANEPAAASLAKSRFVASVSHEIRTPLHAILGIAELTPKITTDVVVGGHISTIRSAGVTLLTLINDVLDFSRSEANELIVKNEDFSLQNLTDYLQKIFHPLALGKNIALNIYCQPDIPDVLHGDHRRINQILSNLFSNAIKFTSVGGITLKILMRNRQYSSERGQNTISLQFIVTDTGMGITDADLDKIFDPFYQSDETRTDQLGGTGLGLPIARLLAHKMGGTLTVIGNRHHGSTFMLNLTLQIGTQPATTHATRGPGSDAHFLSTARILLAEDNPINQQLVRAYLQDSGCTLDIVNNGDKVPDAYVNTRYHLILMDCQMPDLDGFETTRIIRLQESGDQHIPMLAVTASAMESDREICLQAGMDDVLTKPFSREQLITMISRHFTAAAS